MSAGISTFNRIAAVKFQNLTEENKCQLRATQADETTSELTESQIEKKNTNIVGKVRDKTVTIHYLVLNCTEFLLG